MKKTIRLIAGAIALCTLLTACSNGNDKEGAAGSIAEPEGSVSKKPVKIEYFLTNGVAAPAPADDAFKREVDNKLGTDLSFNVVSASGDYINKLNLRFSAGDVPDLFLIRNQNDFLEIAPKGVLLDLTPYLNNELKPVSDYLAKDPDKNVLKLTTYDDKVMALPKSPSRIIPNSTMWIRKDWLDRLQLSVPKTLDELFTVAKAFTEDDPDGNGQKDTYGLTSNGLLAFSSVMGAFGLPYGPDNFGAFYKKDDKLTYSLYEPEMKQALEYMRKMQDAGVLDPDLMTNSGTKHAEKAIQGKVGMVYSEWFNMAKQGQLDKIKEVNPNAEWIQVEPFEGPGGRFDGPLDLGKRDTILGISKSVEKNPEKLNKVFELLNYIASDEGNKLSQFGLENVHYKLEDGKIVATEKMEEEFSFPGYQLLGTGDQLRYQSVKFPEAGSSIDFILKQPRIEIYDRLYNAPSDWNGADAARYIKEEITKFIYGKSSLNNYGKFLAKLDSDFGFAQYRQDVEAQLKEKGYL